MVDPFTAVATATAAFNGIKKMVEAGQNIESTFGQIGKWYGAVSDFNEAKRQAENPPLFKKLVNKVSVEEEAMNVYIQEKKIKEQESQLRELLLYMYGPDAYRELTELRRVIREKREKDVYAQSRRQKAFMWNALGWSSVGVLGYLIYLVVLVIITNSQ
jgi:preprotein translocase subunit Sss1